MPRKNLQKQRPVRSLTLASETTLKGPLLASHKRGYVGLKLGKANFVCITLVPVQNDSIRDKFGRRGVDADNMAA